MSWMEKSPLIPTVLLALWKWNLCAAVLSVRSAFQDGLVDAAVVLLGRAKGCSGALRTAAWPCCSPTGWRLDVKLSYGSVCSQVWVLLFTLATVWWAEEQLSTLLAIWLAIPYFRAVFSLVLFLELLLFAWPELLNESAAVWVDLVRI